MGKKDKNPKAAEKKARKQGKQGKKAAQKEKKVKAKTAEDSDADDVDLDSVLEEYARQVGFGLVPFHIPSPSRSRDLYNSIVAKVS